MPLGRWMGLDVGRRRIGIALSDPLGVTAQPLEVLRCQGVPHDVRRIAELVLEHDVIEIVVGLPLRTDGTRGPEAEYVEAFKEALEHVVPDVPIHLWDERFTTHQAERDLIAQGVRGPRRRQVVDMAAAALILQSFMERRRNR